MRSEFRPAASAAHPEFHTPNPALSSPWPGNDTLPRPDVIAIDGPAGSGKSTTARALASRFGLLYIDTGAMYRALTWAAQQEGVAPADGPVLAGLLRQAHLELKPGRREVAVFWNGRDISAAVRTPEVEEAVSAVAAHPEVRAEMVERQRNLGRVGGVVMEGRDIGSVVFPLATAKIYLDASLPARLERRYRQYRSRGQDINREEIQRELAARDRRDSEREHSPLTISPDATVLDTSDWTLAEQNERTEQTVRDLLARQENHARSAATPDQLPFKYRWAYSGLQAVARYFGLRKIGLPGPAVPKGTIIASNHISWWDPPLIGSTLGRFRVRTLAKAELFRFPPSAAFFRFLEAIPIDRSGFDNRAFAEAIATLQQGDNLFIFPEGTRRPICNPGPIRSGLGILVQKTGAPVQPVFVRGTCHLQPGGSPLSPLEVRFGPVVHMHALPTLAAKHHSPRALSRRIGLLFEAIYRELQARSFAENPPTDWERTTGARQELAYRRKVRRLFGGRAGEPPESARG